MLAKRKPQYPMIHLLIARAMMNLPSPANDAVLLELQQAENNSPSDSEIFYLRGKVSVTAKRYDDAIAAFRRSIELQPNDSRAYYQLARLYQQLGNRKQARELFERTKIVVQNTSQ
jgi:Flp pilus assembly protein TadD